MAIWKPAIGVLLVACREALTLENGLGRLPPMGYNSWNDLRCGNLTAAHIEEIADALVTTGLRDLGYEYLIIDDCWAIDRDPRTFEIVPDPIAFANGMKPVVDFVHSRGLKFGIYTDRGTSTCGLRPGSQGFESLDASTYASWGVDFLKEDSCNAPGAPEEAVKQYSLMRDALNATGRPIYFSLCGWKSWYAPWGYSLGNSWRISQDVNNWGNLFTAAMISSELAEWAKPGGWNDPDMLIGSDPTAAVYFSPTQSRTQFSLWAVLAAPLLMGVKISNINRYDLDTYTNKEVIDLNQDPLGKQGKILWEDCPKRDIKVMEQESYHDELPDCRQIWGKRLVDDAWAVLMINWAFDFSWAQVQVGPTLMEEMGFKYGAMVRDLWERTNLGVYQWYEERVPGNFGSKLFKFTPPVFESRRLETLV